MSKNLFILGLLACLVSAIDKRADYTRTIKSKEGYWGDWSGMQFCPVGTYAYAFRMRVEKNNIIGDDTGANACEIYCSKLGTHVQVAIITPTAGQWGDWGTIGQCPENEFVKGFRTSVEEQQGSHADDTALNNVEMKCGDETIIQVNNGAQWGKWGQWEYCPEGELVCGIETQFEKGQGKGDDTALNTVRLACCSVISDEFDAKIDKIDNEISSIQSMMSNNNFFNNYYYIIMAVLFLIIIALINIIGCCIFNKSRNPKNYAKVMDSDVTAITQQGV